MVLSVTNNNPGNILNSRFTASQPGYVGVGGGNVAGNFAQFDTGQNGFNAMLNLLNGSAYIGGGANTISSIINKWSPATGAGNSVAATNNYINYVAGQTGLSPNTPLTSANTPAVAQSMAAFEGGMTPTQVSTTFGIPNYVGDATTTAMPNTTTPDTGNGDWVGTGSSGGDPPDAIPMTGGTGQVGTASNADQYSGLTGGQTLAGGFNTNVLGAPVVEANTANSSPLGVGDTAYSGNLATSAPVANNTPVSPVTSNPIQPNASAGSGASAATAPVGNDQGTPSLGGGVAGGGAPIDITNAPQVGTQAAGTIATGATNAANTVSKALGGVTSGLGSDTSSVESTGTGWLNSIFGDVNNTLVRVGFVSAGLVVLLLAGLFFFLDAQKGSPNVQVVPAPV